MSVTGFDRSGQDQAPVHLVEFRYGSGAGDVYRVTNSEDEVTRIDEVTQQAEVFSPGYLNLSAVHHKSDKLEVPLDIDVDASSNVASLFGTAPIRRVVFVRVWEGHSPADGAPSAWLVNPFVLVWTGRVLSQTRKNEAVRTLKCEDSGASLKRPLLRRSYSRECQHVLFGVRCQASKPAATRAAVISAVGARQVTLEPDWEGVSLQRHFRGGSLEWTGVLGGETRRIVSASGDVLTLDGDVSELVNGDSVDVVLGCPGTSTACRELHSNIIHYGGTEEVPKANPIGKNNHT